MARSQHDNSPLARSALQALQAAALLLPGLIPAAQAASGDDQVNLQYSRYEEGKRDLLGVGSTFEPLRADTLRLSGGHAFAAGQALHFALSQDTWSGATPITTAPFAANPNRPILRDTPSGLVTSGASPYINGPLALTSGSIPLQQNGDGTQTADARQVLVMSSASPEARQQADVSVSSKYGSLEGSLGVSLSTERDYLGRGINAGISRDFNQQLTTLSLGLSYSEGKVRALLDPDALPYIDRSAWQASLARDGSTERLSASRHDRRVEFGITQIIDADSYIEAALSHGEASGYLGNPYKAVSVVFSPLETNAPTRRGELRALLERRPDSRYQTQLNLHYAHALPFADGAVHAEYRYADDSWNLRAHSVELRWVQPLGQWTLTPHLRWYGQSEADFYTGYLVSEQAPRSVALDERGRQIWTPLQAPDQRYFRTAAGDFLDAEGRLVDTTLLDLQPLQQGYDAALLPAHYSSDHRLASFGSVNGGLTLSRRFDNGVVLEAGLDLYRRRASWGLGSGQDNAFADFRFSQFNVGLQLDLGARSRGTAMATMDHSGHDMGSMNMTMTMPPTPAGLRFAHPMHAQGALGFGYQVQSTLQGGALRSGDAGVDDAAVVAGACGTAVCRYAPESMSMQMHMFMFTWQWRDNLSLMVMPQYMSMDMELRDLAGRPPTQPGEHIHGPGGHQTGDIGDTVVAATWQVPSLAGVQLTMGVSLPTGSVDLEYRRQNRTDGGLLHFDMQTGSGSWDLVPALTWQGGEGRWHYGAQISGIARMEDRNDSGYRLGNQWQATAWASHPVTTWLAGSARLTHTRRGEVSGDFNEYNARLGPMDYPLNQGGRFTDLGLGATIPLPFDQQLSVEWEVPVQDDPNGVQLEREGLWSLNWHAGF